MEGFRLVDGVYQPILPDAEGLLPSERLGVSVAFWRGLAKTKVRNWIRLFRPDGTLVPTPEEAQRRRVEAAETEVARLRVLLADRL